MRNGMLFAAGAYLIWGLFPLYFKLLQGIPPLEILLHRVVWSLLFLLSLLAWRRQWRWIQQLLRQPRVLLGFGASALLLSCNWYLYIWSVNNGRIVDASLGYFINPLVNVLLGFVLLRERLRAAQWCAIALAAGGVLWLTWHSGSLPWISLLLALTFGFYGLLRKTARLGALEGLSLETFLLFPLAFGTLALLADQGQNAFSAASGSQRWLLAAAGPITAVPLLLFAAGARRIPLSLMGLLQYISPSIQLLLGVWLYHEPFSAVRQVGFAAIWAGLALYSLDGLWRTWANKSPRAA